MKRSISLLLLASTACCCSPTTENRKTDPTAPFSDAKTPVAQAKPSSITYRDRDGTLYRIRAQEGASPENLSKALSKLSPGKDKSINISADGRFLIIDSSRFGCADWECLSVVKADLSGGEAIKAAGQLVHADGSFAISSGAATIVYANKSEGGKHEHDLFVVRKGPEGYGAPASITKDSAHKFNDQPALSPNGAKVAFDCGPVPYGQEGTGLCEVNVDGTGLRELHTPGKGWAKGVKAFHHPAYAPDGSIVVEIDRAPGGEQIYRIRPGAEPQLIAEKYRNDNSPCVLPDGRVASLWLDRRGGTGSHEIKVMQPDGSDHFMALQDFDAADVQLGCGDFAGSK